MMKAVTSADIDYLLSPKAVRERAAEIFAAAEAGRTHFRVNPERLDWTANFVLSVIRENYPDLKADDNFRQLQSELSEIEEQLQGARRYYNATVRDLNSTIQSFPNVLFARPLGFSEAEFYADADASIQQAPQVKFGAARA